MLVRRGIRVIPYCLYEPMKRRKTIKCKVRRTWDHLTPSIIYISLYQCLCLCKLISSLLISNILWAHRAKEVPKDLIVLRLWTGSWGVGAWSFGTSDVYEGAFGCCKYLSYFILLFDYMFDPTTHDFSTWMLRGLFERFGGV